MQNIGPEQCRNVQAHSKWGVVSWHRRRSEGPVRWALLGMIAQALVTFCDALRR